VSPYVGAVAPDGGVIRGGAVAVLIIEMHVWKRYRIGGPRRLSWLLAGAAIGAGGCSLQDYDPLLSGVGGGNGLGGSSGSGGSAGDGASGGTAGGSSGSGGTATEPEVDAGPPPNVIANGSFDEGPSLWAPVGNCITQLVTDNPRSGENCLMTSNRTQDWEGPGYTLIGRVEAGLRYQARVWVRADAAAAPYTLKLTYKKRCTEDSADGVYLTLGSGLVTSEWTELTGILEPQDCTLLESVLYLDGAPVGQSFCIDDTSLLLMR
jgi:hypothetical protein